MKRILLVCHGYPFETIGGVGQVIEQLVAHLPRLGWEVHTLVPTSHTWTQQVSISSVQTSWGVLHTLKRPIRRWSQAWRDEKANASLLQWVKQLNPTVIHIHHLNKLPWEWLLLGKNELKYHLWLTLHDYAIPCARGQLLDQYLQLCDEPSTHKCTECIQSWLPLDGWKKQGLSLVHRPEGTLGERIDLARCLLTAMDHIDAPSFNMIEHFKHLYPDISIEHCELPIADAEQHTTEPTSKTGSHRYLFVGSIHPSKGVHILLRAFARLQKKIPDVRLSIIGQESPSDVVNNYAEMWKTFALNTLNVTWLGTLPHNEVLKQMNHHHTLVLPSVWRENSPIVVREALQRGLHVICGRGGSRELSPAILCAQPLGISTLMNQMQVVTNQPAPPVVTYPPAENTISEWVENSTQVERSHH